MDLDQWRNMKGLSWAALAARLGLSQAKQARAYALGHDWPQRAERLDAIIAATDNEVTVEAMHKKRLEFERSSASSTRSA